MRLRRFGVLCLLLLVLTVSARLCVDVTYCAPISAQGSTVINTFKSDGQVTPGDNTGGHDRPDNPDNPDNPKTGDENNVRLWMLLFMGSLLALGLIILSDKRSKPKHAIKRH